MEVSLRDAPPRLHNIILNTYAHIPPDMRGSAADAVGEALGWLSVVSKWCQRGPGVIWPFLILHVIPAKRYFYEWPMLDSNQRPPPSKGGVRVPLLFAVIQKYPQKGAFSFLHYCLCSPLFA